MTASGAATSEPSTAATGAMAPGAMQGAPAAATTTTTTTTDPATGVSAASATTYGQSASVTTTTTTNGPVPDTAENRAKYGGPMSHAGRRSAAKGN
jgi:hypothetical protein